MSFYKKVIVLKEIESGFSLAGKKISGIARIEISGGIAELHLSLINVSSAHGGTFVLFFLDSKKNVFTFDLGVRPFAHGKIFPTLPNVEKGFSSGLCFVKDDIPLTVAYSATEDCPFSLADFKRLVADKCLCDRRKALKEQQERLSCEKPTERRENTQSSSDANVYDDEAVATENYYALSEQIKDKISLIKENSDERLWNENALPDDDCQEKAQEGVQATDHVQDETDTRHSQNVCRQHTHYDTVKKELDEIFNKFPPDQELNAFFLDSRWARVNYSNKSYYVVGVVKENGKEKYICYGVPSNYSPVPPEPLKDCACFIPSSIFDLKGKGYWMMFQDAVSGNCIRLKKTNSLTD